MTTIPITIKRTCKLLITGQTQQQVRILLSLPQSQKNLTWTCFLIDLDITINHAPLVPEVRPLQKSQTQEEPVTKSDSDDVGTEKTNQNEQINAPVISSEDKVENENLQIVWDTWYNDVQPKNDPLGNPIALQKFISEVEKYEKFVDSLLVKTLSGATNLDIKWKEVQEFEVRFLQLLARYKVQ